MSTRFVFSQEVEMAMGHSAVGEVAEPDYLREICCEYGALVDALRARTPFLFDNGGTFTAGFRFYLDAGCHPEMAMVETGSPDEFLALKRASFALLAEAVRDVRGAKYPSFVLMANNHDYKLESTWGCHENHAVVRPFDQLMTGMLPFLATRHVYAGNGRLGAGGVVLFSARARVMRHASGGTTTSDRALFSTARNEPLMSSGPFSGRLHLICGDTLRSELGDYLKVASTALVLAWLDADPTGADDLRLADPIGLLERANVLWAPPGRLHVCPDALRIQRVYLERVARFVDQSPDLPAWCGQAVQRWRDTLDLLERDPLSLSDRLDPFIKLGLFDAALASMGRTWTDLAADVDLYMRLALVDTAYHRVGTDGPFEQLEREGALAHRVLPAETFDDPGQALLEVARGLSTRAAARAVLIDRHKGPAARPRFHGGWSTIWTGSPAGSYLLGDPTCTDVPELQVEPRDVSPDDVPSPVDPDSVRAWRARLAAMLSRSITDPEP